MTRRALDAYYTPDALADAIVDSLPSRCGPGTGWMILGPGPGAGWILEPHVGGGAFARAVAGRWPGSLVCGLDIDPSAAGAKDCARFEAGDFLAPSLPIDPNNRPSLIIGNPPFDRAEAHIRQALEVVAPGGTVVFLLRLAMLESKQRIALWREHPPSHIDVLSERPSFTGGGTDSAAYGVFRWSPEPEPEPKPTTLGWLSWKTR